MPSSLILNLPLRNRVMLEELSQKLGMNLTDTVSTAIHVLHAVEFTDLTPRLAQPPKSLNPTHDQAEIGRRIANLNRLDLQRKQQSEPPPCPSTTSKQPSPDQDKQTTTASPTAES